MIHFLFLCLTAFAADLNDTRYWLIKLHDLEILEEIWHKNKKEVYDRDGLQGVLDFKEHVSARCRAIIAEMASGSGKE